MDENMPNMNGIEATKKILEYEKENNLPHTPIIALTANAIQGDRERFLNAGMDEYLTKPLNKNKLLKVFKKFVSKKF
jgi:osomolarity two-component system sensor histidine kinase NIK1